MPGDLGFDPVGISSWANLGFIQEAEIKHSRLAMLGLAGCLVENIGFKFPGVESVFGSSTVRTDRFCWFPLVFLDDDLGRTCLSCTTWQSRR